MVVPKVRVNLIFKIFSSDSLLHLYSKDPKVVSMCSFGVSFLLDLVINSIVMTILWDGAIRPLCNYFAPQQPWFPLLRRRAVGAILTLALSPGTQTCLKQSPLNITRNHNLLPPQARRVRSALRWQNRKRQVLGEQNCLVLARAVGRVSNYSAHASTSPPAAGLHMHLV